MSSVGPDGMLLGSEERKGSDNAGEGKMGKVQGTNTSSPDRISHPFAW